MSGTTTASRNLPEVPRHRLFIDGSWTNARNRTTAAIVDPSTETVIAEVANGGPDDIDDAVAAARRAFDQRRWSGLSASRRGEILWRIGDLVAAHAEELAMIEAQDVGKPYAGSVGADIPGAADRFRYFAGWATKIGGETLDGGGSIDRHAYTVREPVGVAGLITAWNFPLFQAANKLGPALAAGCTVVLKPAEQAPLSVIRLFELMQEAGIPDGVANLVTGDGPTAGDALSRHTEVNKISFTGSTATGRKILHAAKAAMTRVTLELGGKSPVIVFDDADIDAAIPAIAGSVYANAGQVCSAGSRLFAHEAIATRLTDGLRAHAEALRIGDAKQDGTQLGPVVSSAQLERVLAYCDEGRHDGANVVTGGGRHGERGYFVSPTIMSQVTNAMSIARDEIFGPVLAVSTFSTTDLDDIAAMANDTPYGLAAYVWTRDTVRALKLPRMLRAGLVTVNNGPRDASVPNGGFKQSGWGREHGFAAVEAYTELKSVVVRL